MKHVTITEIARFRGISVASASRLLKRYCSDLKDKKGLWPMLDCLDRIDMYVQSNKRPRGDSNKPIRYIPLSEINDRLEPLLSEINDRLANFKINDFTL